MVIHGIWRLREKAGSFMYYIYMWSGKTKDINIANLYSTL